jgi:hypothetical protein
MNDRKNDQGWAAICRVLQSLTQFLGTAADWVRWLGARTHEPQETFVLLKRAFLQQEPAPARHIFCPECHCQHEVFVWTEDRLAAARAEMYPQTYAPEVLAVHEARFTPVITAICRCDDQPGCADLNLTPAELEVWSLHWPRLARELCRGLDLNQQFVELPIGNTCQVGSWSSEAVPVLLTVQPDRQRLRPVLLELSARFRQRFIVLGPTARHLDASGIELLENANAAYFPLDSNVTLTHNATLQPVRPPGELFAKFSPRLGDSDFSEAQRIFALVQQLDAGARNRLPSVLTVFRLYCIDELTVDGIADKCRCAKSTVSNRLQQIRKTTGTDPTMFRRISAHFDRMMDAASDSRARSRHLRVNE